MTRKDYVKLARAFRDELEYIDQEVPIETDRAIRFAVVSRMVQRVSAVLAEDNTRFDPDRFERAAFADHWN
jgi:hypothetical protein